MPNFIHTKVDPNKLSSTASNISQSIARLNNAFSSIESIIGNGSGLNGTWKGPASQQFNAQYAVDKVLFQSQMKALTTFNDQLKEAAGIFDGADNRARELVNNLKIG